MSYPFLTKTNILILAGLYFLISAQSAQSKESLPEGQKLFSANCARCHGQNARGLASAARALKTDPARLDLTREEVLRKSGPRLENLILGGHGRMPKQEWLTQKQVRSLLKYLQTLQKAYVSKK
jgi:mono/diheme cytochrome c family protein